MTDLTPEELAGLRERAEKDDHDWNMLIDPETVLRLVAMAERRIPGGDVLLAGDLTRALQERDAMAKRAARYREALEYALDEFPEEDLTYGPFPGGDPRRFTPDAEDCTPEEVAAWKAACEAWERGEGEDRGPGCQTFGDGSAVIGTGFGVGTSRWEHPARAFIRAALAEPEEAR